MTPSEKYKAFEVALEALVDPSGPEADAILDQMDDAWRSMSSVEKEEAEAWISERRSSLSETPFSALIATSRDVSCGGTLRVSEIVLTDEGKSALTIKTSE